jgi:hypothetical protein
MRTPRLHQVLLTCIVLAGATLAPMATSPAAAEAPLLWGAGPARRSGETKQNAEDRLQALAGRELAVIRGFYRWDEAWPTSYETGLKADGQTLIMSVRSRLLNGTGVPWAQIASAQPGSTRYNELVGWARRVRDYGAPIYVTYTHEPATAENRDLGTAADFLAAWRRWVSVFRAEGASNVKFMWITTDQAFWLPLSDSRAAAHWYPGDEWVDAIAGDAYNWFECRPGIVNPWRSLRDIIDPQRRFWLNHQSEELWLAEYGTVEDPANPGRKAQWLRDAQALFKTPEFSVFDGVALYENLSTSPCVWLVDTSSTAAAAWRDWGQDPHYGGTVTTPPPPPPPSGSVALVVGSPTSLGTDATLADRLRGRGFTVTVHDDDTVTTSAVAGAAAVLVSQTTSSTVIAGKLRTSTRPVMIWKPSVYDDMGMSPAGDVGSFGRTAVSVTRPDHPLAAGLSGTVTLVSATTPLPYGGTSAAAAVVATVGGRPSLFVYPAGATMSGLVAPACRLAFPLHSDAVPRLTASGWALFDRAVSYAANGCA